MKTNNTTMANGTGKVEMKSSVIKDFLRSHVFDTKVGDKTYYIDVTALNLTGGKYGEVFNAYLYTPNSPIKLLINVAKASKWNGYHHPWDEFIYETEELLPQAIARYEAMLTCDECEEHSCNDDGDIHVVE